jgi:hypothetical protein
LRISRVFINREMLKAARQFMPLVGYGLFVARKSAGGIITPENWTTC